VPRINDRRLRASPVPARRPEHGIVAAIAAGIDAGVSALRGLPTGMCALKRVTSRKQVAAAEWPPETFQPPVRNAPETIDAPRLPENAVMFTDEPSRHHGGARPAHHATVKHNFP